MRLVRRSPRSGHVPAAAGPDSARGQSLVEFSLILFPLFFVLLGIIQFGLIFNTYVTMTNAARDAARLGRLLGGAPLRAARRAEAVLHRRIGGFFTSYDVVLAPTTAAPPPRIGSMLNLNGLANDRAMIDECP